jgi:Mitochondrial carrier protein
VYNHILVHRKRLLIDRSQAYDLGKNLVYSFTPDRETPALSTTEVTAAGFFSAVPTTLIAAPVERAKVLLQVQGQGASGKQYNGVLDVVGKLYKEGGVRSIFRGTFATLARDGPGSAAYFAAYEVAKKKLTPKGKETGDLDLGAVVVAGGLAGVAMWSIAIPPDVSIFCVVLFISITDPGQLFIGHQIATSVSSAGHIHRLFGLHQKDCRSRRCWCLMEGLWACHG